MNGTINRGGDPVVGAIGPRDEDFALTADYLMREGTPEQVAEFERRFVEDGEFYDKVAPAIKAWTLPVTFREIMERPPAALTPDTVAAAPARALAPAPALALGPATAPPEPATLALSAKRRSFRKGRWARVAMRTVTLVQTAGVLAFLALYGLLYWKVFLPDKAKELAQALDAHTAATTPLGALGTASIQPAPRTGSTAPRGMGPGIPKGSRDRPDTGETENALLKAVVAAMGVTIHTGEAETRLFELANGIRVLLRPNSTFRYLSTPIMLRGVLITFEGELAVDLPETDDKYLGAMIMSAQGRAVAARSTAHDEATNVDHNVPTQFAVRCFPGCDAMEVAVAAGSVWISSVVEDSTAVTVEAGQFGLAPGKQVPSLVELARAGGFPKPNLAMRKAP